MHIWRLFFPLLWLSVCDLVAASKQLGIFRLFRVIQIYFHILMRCGGRPNHRHHCLERVLTATALDITMTYFTK